MIAGYLTRESPNPKPQTPMGARWAGELTEEEKELLQAELAEEMAQWAMLLDGLSVEEDVSKDS